MKLDEIGISVVDLRTARAFTSDLVAFEGVGTGKMNIRKTKSVEVGNDFTIHFALIRVLDAKSLSCFSCS